METIERMLAQIFTGEKAALVGLNLQALRAGAQQVLESAKMG